MAYVNATDIVIHNRRMLGKFLDEETATNLDHSLVVYVCYQ